MTKELPRAKFNVTSEEYFQKNNKQKILIKVSIKDNKTASQIQY